MAEEERPKLKGGRMLARDQWYGLEVRADFAQFRRWWHRVGKFEYDGDYIADRASADEVYRDWVIQNRPKAAK